MTTPTKAELRVILKRRRAALTAETEKKKTLDRAIIEHIIASEPFRTASMLLLYAPIGSEINLLPLAREARARGIPIAFPKCNTANNTMSFYILNADMRLNEGAYHIPEPPDGAPLCVPDEHALCILPALSFDKKGDRLGYGKGYYDRFLASFTGVTMGAVYTHMILREVPTEPHDIPVSYLVTEHEILHTERTALDADGEKPPLSTGDYDWKNADDSEEPSPPPQKQQPTVPRGERILHTLKRLHRAAWKKERAEGVKTPHAPLLLVLCTYLFLLLSRLAEVQLLDRTNEYVGVILLQILIFILPAILYCKLRGERFTDRIRLSPIRPSHLPLLVAALVMMITGGLLTSILTGGIQSLVGNFTLYNTFVARTGSALDALYAVLAYALLPALGEELVYRSVLCAEYEANGVAVAVTISALFFAMLHFSFAHFLTYFALGLLLAATMYATRSLLAPVLLHLLYNVFCLFGQPFLSAFYVNAGSTEIFLFCLIVLFLLASAIAAGEGRKIYHLYAVRNADASYTVQRPFRQYPKALLYSLFSPLCIAALIVFLVATLQTLI